MRQTSVAVLAALALTLAGCRGDQTARDGGLPEPTTAAAATDISANQDAEDLVDRNPSDFRNTTQYSDIPEAQAHTVWFDAGRNACHARPAHLDGCILDFQNRIPPFDSDVYLKEGDEPNKVHLAPGVGFVVTESSLESLLEDTSVLNPGEKVTFGDFTYKHLADGTIRVEVPDTLRKRRTEYADARYWFELSPGGQYSSHRFDPSNPPKPITDPATHFAEAIDPGMQYCNYFPAMSGTYFTSASDPEDCLGGTSVVQRFVYEDTQDTQTYPGNGVTWYCLNSEHGIVCNRGTPDHVAAEFIAD